MRAGKNSIMNSMARIYYCVMLAIGGLDDLIPLSLRSLRDCESAIPPIYGEQIRHICPSNFQLEIRTKH
jgi:hypothetical protein